MRKAFTLIELLVVIAIIAILAAILFPVFAQAKQAAKKSADLSNIKQMSLGFMQYIADTDDVLPTAYFHRSFNPALGGTNGGYIHWSALTFPYVKNWDIYVGPGDNLRGHAPTCYNMTNVGDRPNNSGRGWPGGQVGNLCTASAAWNVTPVVDDQAPRLSYTVNSAILPRLRNILDVNRGITIVSGTALDAPSSMIMITNLTDNLNCMNGASITGLTRNSSHRSTNAYARNNNGTGPYFGSAEDATAPNSVFALNFNQVATGANSIFTQCRNGVSGLPLITYTAPFVWGNGANYGMADGSAKFMNLGQTLNPARYMWGHRVYSDRNIQVIDPISNLPTQLQ